MGGSWRAARRALFFSGPAVKGAIPVLLFGRL